MTLERNDDLGAEPEELDDEEVEVAEIRADIEETRVEMGGTLQELGDRLDPGHLVEQAKENVREATIGRVEETAQGMRDMVMETIKRNPIPAAMAGAGLALLWMNRSNGSSHGDGSGQWHASGTRYGGMYGTTSSYGQTGRGSEPGIGERAGEAVGAVGQRAGEAVGQVGETVGQVGQTVGSTVGQGVEQASWRLERLMQSSPLAMGAIALGAGAVIGTLVPETEPEQRVLGDASRAVGGTVRDAVNEATDRAEEQLDRVEREVPA